MLERLIAQSSAINATITNYVVTPLLIFFGGIAISVLLRNIVQSALNAVQLDKRLHNTSSISVSTTIANTVYVIGWIISASLGLAHIGLFAFTLQRISFFLFWVGLLAAGFALTDAIRNLHKRSVAREKYPVGSQFVLGSVEGLVTAHGITRLIIENAHQEQIHVPYLTAARANH